MKLIIQIPCYNEAETLPVVLAQLPRKLEGFDAVEWLIIDDGSRDGTSQVARDNGVDYVVRFPQNRGLAAGFVAGLQGALRNGADVIVNIDADNQYEPGDIGDLVAPILAGEADMVVGERPISTIKHFSPIKKLLQKLGSGVVRRVSNTEVPDAPSGFRALSREAALQINVYSEYTYTLESIIQAGRRSIAVTSVPIRVNEDLRPSRLVRSIPAYIRRSLSTMVRIFVVYRPFAFFMTIGAIVFLAGFAIGVRFLYFFFQGQGDGHIQSLILAAVLLGMGFQTMLVAFLSDLLAVNRKLLEDVQYRLRKRDTGSGQ